MQTVSLPLSAARTRRIVAVALASAAAATATFVVAENDSPVVPAPAPAADSVSGGGASELSTYDGALLRHHGIKAVKSTPAASGAVRLTPAQRQAAESFHHFR